MDEQNGSGDTMAEKLQAAGEKAETQKKERRARQVKGSHLLDPMKQIVEGDSTLKIETLSAYLQVRAEGVKGKKLYIAKKGGRVDLSGYQITDPAVKTFTKQEAQEKHLGKVQATIDFDQSDEAVMSAFRAAVADLKVAPPAPPPAETTTEATQAPAAA